MLKSVASACVGFEFPNRPLAALQTPAKVQPARFKLSWVGVRPWDLRSAIASGKLSVLVAPAAAVGI